MIAALFVAKGGAYFGLDGVDPWDEALDARRYRGPWPVVAHPPCARWCRLAGLVESRWGYRRGVDGGCFASALASVRAYGGVLEHPAYSDAWEAFGLPQPSSRGGWTMPDGAGGSSCHVEQHAYGHEAKKATWLYVVGATLPELINDRMRGRQLRSYAGHINGDDRARLTQRETSATPPRFREVLLTIARSVTMPPRPRVLPRRLRRPVHPTLESHALGAQRQAFRRSAHAFFKVAP